MSEREYRLVEDWFGNRYSVAGPVPMACTHEQFQVSGLGDWCRIRCCDCGWETGDEALIRAYLEPR